MTDSTALVLPSPATSADLAELAPLVERARDYAQSAKADRTRDAYRADFATFRAWCDGKGLPSLPTTPATVAVYLAALADDGYKVSTLERALAGIVDAQRAAGTAWPKGNPAIRETLCGIRRRLGTAPAKKAPIVDGDLAAMIGTLGVDRAGLRDRSLLTMGWFGAFRRSELVALTTADIATTREGLLVTLRRSKTDQEGRGEVKGLPYAGNVALCPVRALEAWLAAAGIAEGAVFRAVDQVGRVGADALCDRTVARIVKRTAQAAGLDSSKFAGHSLRAGFATTAAKKGKPLDAIMRQTGHRSERVARGYIRMATAFENNAAAGLV